MDGIRIGLIREGKTPTDSRVTLTPTQAAGLIKNGYDVVVQPSKVRAFSDEEYTQLGVPLKENLSDRDVLIGVKEVPIDQLIEGKTYFFFSHTHKQQVYNRDLLQAVVRKKIRLIDYEVLTDDDGNRLIAFGKFAGMVGAHNGMWAYGRKTQSFELPRMHSCRDYQAMTEIYKKTPFPNVKVVLTGTGRVARGAAMVLSDMGLKKVTPIDFVMRSFDVPVYTQLNSFYYVKRKDGETFDSAEDFYRNPEAYESDFEHFLRTADVFVNGIFWDNRAPAFFSLDDMKDSDFNLRVIADVTCDIAPVSSIPSTLRPATIDEPVFGFDVHTHKETPPFLGDTVDMMTVDNLPNELPRDASDAFGQMFIDRILPEFDKPQSKILERATIARDGKLGSEFGYLADFLEGR